MSRAGGWAALARNQLVAGGVALVVAAVAITFALVRDTDDASELSAAGPDAIATSAPASGTGTQTAAPDATASASSDVPGARVGGNTVPGPGIPGVPGGPTPKPCTKRHVEETGVTDSEITIGQLITDSNQIPQQFKPAYEGLSAYVKLINASGGVCGRKLRHEYRNDQLQPAIHAQDIRELGSESIAFVGNESVLDQLDYDSNPPFEPRFEAGGSYVPDVGGLAFSYARGQSAWHAGVIGSVSPTLVGGGQFKYFQEQQKAAGKPCTKGGILYLSEPTGASEDQARVGQVSIEQDWGAGLGKGNTKLYSVSLIPPADENTFAGIVRQMADDGMDCVYTYTDLNSSIRMARAMRGQGYWPPKSCSRGAKCFRFAYVPLAAYDEKFIRDAGDAAVDFSIFIPHIPVNETKNAAMRVYLDALKKVPNAKPSTFSVIGFASGAMFVEALQPCAAAPTRECLMSSLRKMQGFTAGGLLGGTTPFRRTRATFGNYGTFDWKWIFNTTVSMRVLDRNGKRDFYRLAPASGFRKDTIRVARGTPG
jgi:ABC-type branched-subunit amino acid transport system substrate-binding protein